MTELNNLRLFLPVINKLLEQVAREGNSTAAFTSLRAIAHLKEVFPDVEISRVLTDASFGEYWKLEAN